jgi:hypothetical protein
VNTRMAVSQHCMFITVLQDQVEAVAILLSGLVMVL